MKRSRKRVTARVRTFVALGILSLLLAIIVLSSVADTPANARPEDRVAAERIEPVAGGLDFVVEPPPAAWVVGRGVIEPRDRPTEVSAEISGIVGEILVREGEQVGRGAVLAKLDTRGAAAELAVAEADVLRAEVELDRATRGSLRTAIDTAKSSLAEAAEGARQKDQSWKRLTRVLPSGGVSQQDVDIAYREMLKASAREDAAASTLRLETQRRQEGIREAKAALARANANLDSAQVRLEQRIIRTPHAGEVLQIRFREGEYFDPAREDPLFVIGDTSVIRVRLDVDERDVRLVHARQTALVRTDADPKRQFSAEVISVGRRMGRKNVRTDDPTERNDTKILEVVLAVLEAGDFIIGERVDGYLQVRGGMPTAEATDDDKRAATPRTSP